MAGKGSVLSEVPTLTLPVALEVRTLAIFTISDSHFPQWGHFIFGVIQRHLITPRMVNPQTLGAVRRPARAFNVRNIGLEVNLAVSRVHNMCRVRPDILISAERARFHLMRPLFDELRHFLVQKGELLADHHQFVYQVVLELR